MYFAPFFPSYHCSVWKSKNWKLVVIQTKSEKKRTEPQKNALIGIATIGMTIQKRETEHRKCIPCFTSKQYTSIYAAQICHQLARSLARFVFCTLSVCVCMLLNYYYHKSTNWESKEWDVSNRKVVKMNKFVVIQSHRIFRQFGCHYKQHYNRIQQWHRNIKQRGGDTDSTDHPNRIQFNWISSSSSSNSNDGGGGVSGTSTASTSQTTTLGVCRFRKIIVYIKLCITIHNFATWRSRSGYHARGLFFMVFLFWCSAGVLCCVCLRPTDFLSLFLSRRVFFLFYSRCSLHFCSTLLFFFLFSYFFFRQKKIHE